MASKSKKTHSTSNFYTVRPDQTPADEYRNYDTLSGIAAEWLKQNPRQEQFQGTFAQKLRAVQEWMIKENKLKTRDGKECDFRKITDAVIHVGEELTLPVGNKVVNPSQHREKCAVLKSEPAPDTAPLASLSPAPAPVVAPAPTPAPEAPTQKVAVRLPIFPTQGNLSNGQTAGMYNAVNKLTFLLGDIPQLPHTAARGSSPYGVGIQAISPDVLRAVSHVLPWAPIPFTAGAYQGVVAPIGIDTNLKGSQDRVAHAREGGNGSSQEGREEDGGLNLLPSVTDKTKYDATLLWGVGVEHDGNVQLRDLKNDRYNNNQFYVIRGEGADMPSITLNERYVTTGKHSDFLQATPSGPQDVPLNNYAAAARVDGKYIIPRLNELNDAYGKQPSKETVQELVALYNLRSDLTGISNYPVNADVSKPLSPDAIKRLNPAEQIAYNKARLLDDAASKGINVSELNLTARADARTISKEQLHTNMINYYTEVAKVKEGAFRDIYKDYVKADAEFKVDDEASRRAAATKFVESLPYYQSYPQNGHSLASEEYLFLSPRSKFNPVEKFEYVPKTMPKDASALKGAMEAIAESPENIQAVLRAAGEDPQVMQAIGKRDDLSVQLTKWHGEKNTPFDRDAAIAAIKARGYSDGVMDTQFHGDFTNGILRRPADMMKDLSKSADDLGIVAQRSRDFREMVTDGEKGSAIAPGAHANALLYALAQEKDNATLLKIEENIRKSAKTPAEAEQKIEALRQGVTWAKDHVSAIHFRGTTHTQVGRSVAAASARSATGKALNEMAPPALEVEHVTMAAGQEPDPAKRDTAIAVAELTAPTTRPLAVTALHSKDPTVVSAGVIEALRANPELRAPVLKSLREAGGKKAGFLDNLFNRTPEHLLAYDLEKLFAAQDALASNPADAQATADLAIYTAKVQTQMGVDKGQRATIIASYLTAPDAQSQAALNAAMAQANSGLVATALSPEAQKSAAIVGGVLAGAVVTTSNGGSTSLLSGASGDKTFKDAAATMAAHDHTNSAANSTTAGVAGTNQTTSGLIVPVIPIVRRKPEPKPQPATDQPIPGDTVPGCCDNPPGPTPPPGSPTPPARPPVKTPPPPTPPPTPEPPVGPKPCPNCGGPKPPKTPPEPSPTVPGGLTPPTTPAAGPGTTWEIY